MSSSSQIRLNSRGLIYPWACSWPPPFVTGLRYPCSPVPTSPHPLGFSGCWSLFGHQMGLASSVDRDSQPQGCPAGPVAVSSTSGSWQPMRKLPSERCQPPLRSTACLKSNTNIQSNRENPTFLCKMRLQKVIFQLIDYSRFLNISINPWM